MSENFTEKPYKTKPRGLSLATMIWIVVAMVAIAAAIYLGYRVYKDYQDVVVENKTLTSQVNNPDLAKKAQEDKANDILDKLEKILLVEETKDDKGNVVRPAVATIQDKEKVKQSNPEFYKYVENGDYLIIYPTRAIIYRESENKIMNIAPIITPQADTKKTT